MTEAVPLALGGLLETVGLGGSAVAAASILFTAWKGKHVLDLLARVGTWVRVGGAVLVLVLLASTGLIPGIDLSVNVATVADAVGPLFDRLGDLAGGLL